MKSTKNHSYPGIQIGISFLLVVFIILCLVIFSTLSLSGTLRDYEYSRRSARRTTDYYHACSMAQEHLCEIDLLLREARQSTHDQSDYLDYVSGQISAIPELTLHTDTDPATISFTEEINANQDLEVTLELTSLTQTADRCYKIIKWKETASKNWNAKTTLPVIGSDSNETETQKEKP